MKEICKGHNTCEFRESCEHAVPHECGEKIWISKDEYISEKTLYFLTDCNCDVKYLRYDKLNNLKDVSKR